MSSYSHILGEGRTGTYCHVISNTNDDINNSPYLFINEPYGGLKFDETRKWRLGISQGSLPRTQSGIHKTKSELLSYNQLWYKRWTLPEECSTTSTSAFCGMYQKLMDEKYLTNDGYKLILNTLPKQTCRFDINSLIMDDDGKTFPDTLKNFLLHSYNEYPTPFAYFSDVTKGGRTYILKRSFFQNPILVFRK